MFKTSGTIEFMEQRHARQVRTAKRRFAEAWLSGILGGVITGGLAGFTTGTLVYPLFGSLYGMVIGTAMGAVGGVVLGPVIGAMSLGEFGPETRAKAGIVGGIGGVLLLWLANGLWWSGEFSSESVGYLAALGVPIAVGGAWTGMWAISEAHSDRPPTEPWAMPALLYVVGAAVVPGVLFWFGG